MTKIDYFKEDSVSRILDKKFIPFKEIPIENIPQLAFSNEYTILPSIISNDNEVQRKLLKHGLELKLERTYSARGTINSKKTKDLIIESLDSFNGLPWCYSFKPYWGMDRKTRRIHLIDCVNGARLYAYGSSNEKIKILPYTNSERVEKEGGQIYLEVPSTTKEEGPHKFEFSFVPIVNNENKKIISLQLSSDHNCGYKRFLDLKFNYPNSRQSSKTNDFCFHEIAGYLAIIDYFYQKGIKAPLETNPFVIPTLLTKGFNIALENNVLILDKNSKHGVRKPKIADKEILNWQFLKLLGVEQTFFPTKTRDGNIRDYAWK
jgi:hypothetical protein